MEFAVEPHSVTAMTVPAPIRLLCTLGAIALLASCGGGDDEASETSTTTTTTTEAPAEAVQQIVDELISKEVTADEGDARCFAERTIAELGEDQAVEVAGNDTDLHELPDDQRSATVAALNECVSGESFADGFVAEFYGSVGAEQSSPEVTACFSDEVEGRFGDMALELSASTAPTEAPMLLAALESCVPSSAISDVFTAAMEGEGFPAPAARCIGDRLAEEMSIGDMMAMGFAGDEISSEFQATITAATTACMQGTT